jgi:hypothetical protein
MDYRRPCTVATKLYTVKCKKHAKHLRPKIVLLNQCLVFNFVKASFQENEVLHISVFYENVRTYTHFEVMNWCTLLRMACSS